MHNPLMLGDTIHGFASGLFGRDHSECMRVEAIGHDWAVVRGILSPSYLKLLSGEKNLKFAGTICQRNNVYHCDYCED